MEEILVKEKEISEYLDLAKKALENGEIELKAYGRDTVKAVDVAENLKKQGFKVSDIKINTEEKDGKRISTISIKITR